ncbi:hypothetical protein Pla52n_20790 [Stieleria varia]|uniref:Uncharacterized protein n=1 Tax=Stieleria varia TaxID=2528005 RepID=A0A5C6B332_9BACT|nr:hypothetical protein Pla52n_20790 [Stieleria varia]
MFRRYFLSHFLSTVISPKELGGGRAEPLRRMRGRGPVYLSHWLGMATHLTGHAIDLESRATIVVRLSKSKTNTTIRPNTNHTPLAVLQKSYLSAASGELTGTCGSPQCRSPKLEQHRSSLGIID